MAKGLFKPTNPEKYLGDIGKIRFMSSWELRFMNFCDTNPNVIKWGSEEFKIAYFNPIKNKVDSIANQLLNPCIDKGFITSPQFDHLRAPFDRSDG